jgi:1-acyl-sn-glycerol-3-phosphate acyltransferase
MSLLETFKGVVDTGRISVATVVDAALDRLNPKASDERLAWWSQKVISDARATIVVRGREHLGDGHETFIVMSNHQSFYDIPALYRAIPGRLRMVGKAELFRIPVWGRAMIAAGMVRVDRGDRQQAVASLREGGAMLEEGTLLWIAPEGTRSVTGELGPFKSGGFYLALETGHRILPVAIDGTRDILPAKKLVVQKDKRVVVTILPPIDPKDFGTDKRKELTAAVRDAIARALKH